MSQQVIRAADLSYIENTLRVLSDNVHYVSQKVDVVQNNMDVVYSTIEQLEKQFQDFVEKDKLFKNLQHAETRIIKVRQELDKKYGYHDEVRRRITGILQAVDVSLVRKETIASCTEELMLSAPRYWLAPCLIAISAWVNDNKELADRAIKEALRRDDEKTSLLFALISRRANRLNASEMWLERYLSMQDPTMLEREMIIIIDAFANGLFGEDSQGLCLAKIRNWVLELSNQEGFIEEQQSQWSNAIESKIHGLSIETYEYLRKYSPDWDKMETFLRCSKLHQTLIEHFEKIYHGPIEVASNIQIAIDDLLDKLVSKFDQEELPLRREERLADLIVEEQGDKTTAEQRFQLEQKALDFNFDFTQLLTNAAMHPETSHASKASQRLAVAFGKDWIVKAYEDITAKNRSKALLDIHIKIEDWDGVTRDGTNETDLIDQMNKFIDRKLGKALYTIKPNLMHWFGVVGGGIVVLAGIISGFNILLIMLGLAGVVWFLANFLKFKRMRKQVEEDFAKYKVNSQTILKAVVAEIVDWRRESSNEDAKHEEVIQFLNSITPEQHILSNYNNARAILR